MTLSLHSRVEHTSDEAVAAMKLHNAMQKIGRANSKTAPMEKAKKERKRRKATAQLVLDPNVEYNQLEASHSANILSLRHVICSLCCHVVMFPRSGALKRLMMLDLQRIEDEKLLQLPRLNPVSMILEVLSDRELPQVIPIYCFPSYCHTPLQLLRKGNRVVELGDDGWECTCMICGREGQLMMCEHGMQASDTLAQCPKVAHAKCVGLTSAPDIFICPLHPDSCCAPEIREKFDAKMSVLDDSTSILHTQVLCTQSVCEICQQLLQLKEKCEAFAKSFRVLFDAALPYAAIT
jgi:hypothetical protein